MKLSFSTNGWDSFSWVDFYTMAKDLEFSGIEIHDIMSEDFSGKNRPFSSEQIVGTARKLREIGVEIPCIDVVGDISDPGCAEKLGRDIPQSISKAALMDCPYVRVRAGDGGSDEAAAAVIEKALPAAEAAGVTLLVETAGIYSDTARLRDETGFQLYNYAPRWVGIYKDDGMPVEPGASAAEYLAKQSEYDQSFLAGYDVEYPAELHGGAIERLDYYPVWALTIEDGSPAAVSQQKMLDIETRYYPRLILAADEAEFESIWTEFVNEFNAVDLASYQEEIDRQIAAKMGS